MAVYESVSRILPPAFTSDAERVARFRRETQGLASLNHPHIAQIYGLDEANGSQFLVFGLIDGESLDKRLARGGIPIEAFAIAEQMADALEAAHEKGIIHRDSSAGARSGTSFATGCDPVELSIIVDPVGGALYARFADLRRGAARVLSGAQPSSYNPVVPQIKWRLVPALASALTKS